jgi:cyclophilin family peptidyl-prolyl cis-trans isomerase
MRRSSLIISATLLAILTSTAVWISRVGADDKQSKKSADTKADKAPKLSEKELLKQWAELSARHERIMKSAAKIRAEFESAKTKEEQKKLELAIANLREEFETEVQPALLKLGPKVYERRPTDALAAQIAIGALMDDRKFAEIVTILKKLAKGDTDGKLLAESVLQLLYRENRFDDIISVADIMAEAKDADSRILMLDSLAHFNVNDFEKAKEFAARASKDPEAAKGAAKLIADCETQADLWKRELAIRAAEAKANDLPRVTFHTNEGDIVLELFENEAPNTVANFISLVETKKYNGVKFHRVIPGFMAQGGDPNTLDDNPRNDGLGGPGYTIDCECYTEKARMHFQGSLSMAHAGKDTGGSQFFLTFVPTTHLNWSEGKDESNHTVFGRIIEGVDVALALKIGDEIQSAEVNRKRPHAYVPKRNAEKPQK